MVPSGVLDHITRVDYDPGGVHHEVAEVHLYVRPVLAQQLLEHTYVARTQLQLEPKLQTASDNLCKLVTVTGPTKCGKSVLTQKVYPRDHHVWLDGGSVDQEDDLWQQVVDQLNLFTDFSAMKGSGSDAGLSGELSGQLRIPGMAKGKAKLAPSLGQQRNSGTTTSRSLSPKSTCTTRFEGDAAGAHN